MRHPGRQRGRLVDLRGVTEPVYLVGDVHAKSGRILDLLRLLQLEPALAAREAYLVFLGDLFHREERERIEEMDSSLVTLETVLELKQRYPTQVYWLLGNHEFTRTERCKYGCFQGVKFREALEARGLGEFYDTFVAEGALTLLHDRCAAVHAGPAVAVQTLEELVDVPVTDVDTPELHPAVVQLTCSRHLLWSAREKLTYSDADVDRFLQLCGCPDGLLITGHTPLNRECDWHWRLGARTHVIFAAGRELGCAVACPAGVDFRRLGRSHWSDDDKLEPCASSDEVEIRDSQELQPHVTYRFQSPSGICLRPGLEEDGVMFCWQRQLPPALLEFYGQGYYLVGNPLRSEVHKLPRNDSFVLGPSGPPFRAQWLSQEVAVVSQADLGELTLRPLVPGLRLEF